MAVLNCIEIKNLLTFHLPLQQEIWLVFNSTSNLIGVTYIHHWSTDPLIHPSITYPTRRLRGIFFYKKITQKTKNTRLKNPTDLLHKNLMKPLHISANCNVSKLDKLLFSMIPLISDFICILLSTFVISSNYLSSLYLWWCKTRITAVKQHWKQK